MHCMNNDADAAHVYFGAQLHDCFNKCTVLLPWSTTSHHVDTWSSCCHQTSAAAAIPGDLNHTQRWMWPPLSLTPQQLRYVSWVKNLGVITVGWGGGLKLQSIDYDKQRRLSVWKRLRGDVLILHCQGHTIGRKQSSACKYVEYIVGQLTDLNRRLIMQRNTLLQQTIMHLC